MLTSETDSPVTCLLIFVGNIGNDSCNTDPYSLGGCEGSKGKFNLNKCILTLDERYDEQCQHFEN